MLTENRKYHFIGELNLNRSRVLDEQSQPKDDKVNWLFLKTGEQQFSFVYRIENPQEAIYGIPFKVELAFTMVEAIEGIIKLNHTYEVLRGQEHIGTVSVFNVLD
ncbi:hypothetical protein [Flavobacterium piscis]|uniref:Uncharacterized protein n=1 Tax=Flavobacterium piscis TaxID=1114874 RepID=A0ABU1YGP8_9FLAO|nr:hypothetical protein [Flavobacterium piscis]MDR7212726.1 hypothetical protein [Flavobacterium piscis]